MSKKKSEIWLVMASHKDMPDKPLVATSSQLKAEKFCRGVEAKYIGGNAPLLYIEPIRFIQGE